MNIEMKNLSNDWFLEVHIVIWQKNVILSRGGPAILNPTIPWG